MLNSHKYVAFAQKAISHLHTAICSKSGIDGRNKAYFCLRQCDEADGTGSGLFEMARAAFKSNKIEAINDVIKLLQWNISVIRECDSYDYKNHE